MTGCRCPCSDRAGDGAHAVMAALADGDVDRALELGLLDTAGCPGCHPACNARRAARCHSAAPDERKSSTAATKRALSASELKNCADMMV